MKMELEFAELHAPLFLNGTNLQMKLDPINRRGLKLIYDQTEKELIVTWMGKTAIVPISNVASMTPADMQPPQVEAAKTVPAVRQAIAQVETPQSHVFAGPGKGVTGQEGRGKPVL